MNIRELVLKERELSEVIEKGLNELDMLADLGTMLKYKNSKTITEKFEAIENKTMELLMEKKKITDLINKAQETLDFSESLDKQLDEELDKEARKILHSININLTA